MLYKKKPLPVDPWTSNVLGIMRKFSSVKAKKHPHFILEKIEEDQASRSFFDLTQPFQYKETTIIPLLHWNATCGIVLIEVQDILGTIILTVLEDPQIVSVK